MDLLTVRQSLVDQLVGGDPAVNAHLSVEGLDPPGLLLLWSDPWLEPETWCQGWANPEVCCVAGRQSPADSVNILDRLVAFTLGRLGRSVTWTRVTGVQLFPIGTVDYLSCRVVLRVPVTWAVGSVPWPVDHDPNPVDTATTTTVAA